jgi:hypothetical protein
MFTVTDSTGYPVPTPDADALAPLVASDVQHLALWVRAAHVANDRDYCHVYDEIASTVGGPTRDELASMGLFDSEFEVTGTRTVTITVRMPFSTTYSAARPGDVRREFSLDDLGDIDSYDLAQAVRDGEWSEESDDIEVDSVERS